MKKDIERFRILAFRKDGEIHGSIFVKTFKDGAEVYGLFIDKEHKNRGIECALLDEMLANLYNEMSLEH